MDWTSTLVIAALVFFLGHCINIIYITVFYHRGIAHQAFFMGPALTLFVQKTGFWLTGIDPMGWACMHRLHHQYSDQPGDPHNPKDTNALGMFYRQLLSYKNTVNRLITKNDRYLKIMSDTTWPISWANQFKLWFLPYLLHGMIAMLIGYYTHSYLISFAYFFGLMSHPFHGWLVNYLCHKYGYRTFSTQDESRNSHWIGLTLFGEGYHNNHHHDPTNPKFSFKKNEFDLGWFVIQVLFKLRLAKPQRTL